MSEPQDMGALRLSKWKLIAIIDALSFVMAGEWDEDSHDPDGDYEGALTWAQRKLADRNRRQP